ncbi:MAG: site-specific integrase [Candidatus Omnitrophota bacterium]|jgi:integrase
MKTEQKRGRKLGETFKNGYREDKKFFVFKRPRRKNWYYCYYDTFGRKHIKAGYENKGLTEIELNKRREEKFAGKNSIEMVKADKMKFEIFAETFLENWVKLYKKENTYLSYKAYMIPLKEYFAGKYLFEISKESVDNYVAWRLKQYNKNIKKATTPKKLISKSSVIKEQAALRSLFDYAVEQKIISRSQNTPKEVRFLPKPEARTTRLAIREIPLVINSCSTYNPKLGHLRVIALLALHTGMRFGEIAKLPWDKINLKDSIITLTGTKNNESREVPVTEELTHALESWRDKPEGKRYMQSNEVYVFYNKKSKKHMGNCRTSWKKALLAIGLKDYHFHDNRRTVGTQMHIQGENVFTIQAQLGHKDLRSTAIYVKISTQDRKKAMDKLSQRISAEYIPLPVEAPKINTKLIPLAKNENNEDSKKFSFNASI